jgi:putative ABC transport system permease protein
MRLHVPEIQTPDDRGFDVGIHAIDDQVLGTLDIPLVAGRALRSGDGRVALISRSMADRLGGPARAIDREVRLASAMPMPDPLAGAYRVVGVVGDVAYDGLGEQETRRYIRYGDPTDGRAARLDVYVPLEAMPVRQVSIGVRVSGDPAAAIDPLRRVINAMAPASAVHWAGTMTDELALEYAPSRFYAVLIVAFSTSALALTGVGLFAVLTHGVSRRTPEIGLRAAMGATPLLAARLVLASGLVPLAAGAVAGLLAAVAGTRVLASQLYGTTSLDAFAFAGATGALVLVAIAASVLPARRAAKLDPLTALRQTE